MALQPFQVSDGSTIFYDPTTKKIMTEGGKQDSFYKANSIQEAQTLWNTRLGNRGSNSGSSVSSINTSGSYSGGQPTIDLNSIYNKELNSPDILSLQKEIDTKKQGYNTAVTSINDNPFASEATRVGKIARLDNTAQREILTLEEKLAQRKADAQVKVNVATQQYNINSQQYQNELSKLNMLISSGALLNASGNDVAQIAQLTGMSTSMINGIQNKMKTDAIKPQVITNTDNNGRVTVSVIDGNTGKVISQNSLGNIGSADKTSTANQYKPGTATYVSAVNAMTQDLQSQAGSDKRVSPDSYTNYRQQWVQAGFDPSDFDSAFKGFINPTHAQDYLVGMASPGKQDILQSLGIYGN